MQEILYPGALEKIWGSEGSGTRESTQLTYGKSPKLIVCPCVVLKKQVSYSCYIQILCTFSSLSTSESWWGKGLHCSVV